MNCEREIASTDTRVEVAAGRAERSATCARLFALAGLMALGSCGGGGGGSSPPPPSIPYTMGVYKPSSTFTAQCAAPRSGTDPFTGLRYPDVMGSTLAENNWLRSWTNELYLWYREVPDLDPHAYSTTDAYFQLLKTSGTNPSGTPKDKSSFHFTYPTAVWETLSQSGVQVGYGAYFFIVGETLPVRVFVAYTEINSPAVSAPANLLRGAEVLVVDGQSVSTATTLAAAHILDAGLFPADTATPHTFTILDPGAQIGQARSITMTPTNVTEAPVQNAHIIPGTTVGYMLFNDHLATAEQALIAAVNQLRGVSDLVLDIRYNGGGYLDIASELAYMIAGPTRTGNNTFELTVFNDKHPTIDPVTNQPIVPVLFHSTTLGLSAPAGQQLPTLNLPRIFVLTGGDTCSASESIINGLQGIGVTVFQFGSTTCGKPYGFHPIDNCGTTYFSIQFQGVNQMVFGAYGDGFAPANTNGIVGVPVPGCSVADDLSHALGDANEGRLAAALAYIANPTPNSCPAATGSAKRLQKAFGTTESTDGTVPKSPWQQNRIYRR